MAKEDQYKLLLKKFRESATELYDELKNSGENNAKIEYVRSVVGEYNGLLSSLAKYKKDNAKWKEAVDFANGKEQQPNENNE